jgi:hypothetical protein
VRVYLAYAIIVSIVLFIAIQPVIATPITAIPFISTDNVVFIEPLSIATGTYEEFNSASVFDHSFENLDISFPLFNNVSTLGPSTLNDGAISDGTSVHGLETANVLPFGKVDLAFPSISQTADDSSAYERTYFFTDTFT